MTTKYTPGLFITGTDTGVGKTHVAATIARKLVADGLRVGVYKPAASGATADAHGNLTSDDAVQLWEAAGRQGDLERVCPQRFAAPLAPHLAARAEGRAIDARLVVDGLKYWRDRSDIVIVEGAGGLFSPFTDDRLNIDVAGGFGYPLVIVAPNRLGTIHGVLATVVAAGVWQGERLSFGAVVLSEATVDPSDASRDSNFDEIRRRLPGYTDRQITQLAYGSGEFTPAVDWRACAGVGDT
jgi:dethiobiotin synthetase